MDHSETRLPYQKLFFRFMEKPSVLLLTLVALGILTIAGITLGLGELYVARLEDVDATTLVMVSLLLLRAVWKLPTATNMETISIALVSCLSFLFSYEAIYKWSFYLLPWRMPPSELREFLLQAAVGLVILAGFALQLFKLKRIHLPLLGLFLVTWLFWLAVGFPQLWDGQNFYPALLDLPLSWAMIYAVNRATKFIWFLLYFSIYA
jgi:hypothetical protein